MNYFGKMLEYKYCRLTDIMLSFFRAVYNLGTTQLLLSYFVCLHILATLLAWFFC